ncbi:N-acetylmuramoyl-L-alanine amidase [Parelusimicrobium proximum]|uniref:N-acetylmuramoyl-L-alanine amidase n=1 Tax=Parelusimicrobium proximum TaxID=3228953 RepID=UPI003D17739D
MKKTLFLILTILFLLSKSASAQDYPVAANLAVREKNPSEFYPINVEYPHENMQAGNLSSTFIFGSVYDPKATLTVNGSTVPVHASGTFLTYQPVAKGDFSFILETELDGVKYSAARKIKVQGFDPAKYTKKAEFDPECTTPAKDIIARAGTKIDITACGTPGAEVKYSISIKGAKDIQMQEKTPGVYTSSFIVLEDQKAKKAKIDFRMRDTVTKTKAKERAKGRVLIMNYDDVMAGVIKDEYTRLRTGPSNSTPMHPFMRAFDKVTITDKINGMYKVVFDENNYGWIAESKVKLTEDEEIKKMKISQTAVFGYPGKSKIVFYADKKTSLNTQHIANDFYLTFFYTDSVEDNFIYNEEDSFIQDVSYEFITPETLKFKITPKEGKIIWGYEYNFDDAGNFVLTLFHKPEISSAPALPLNGAKIFLDPGHSPKRTPQYDGAVGPSGLLEYEINMTVAKELKPKLEKLGAKVIMSKDEKETVSLQKRVDRAVEAGAHIYVSIHHNALPNQIDPFTRKRGSVIYYFYEHSKALAEAVNKSFAKHAPVLNDGTLTGDFHVIRYSQIPAILTENSFMLYPEQEALLKDDKERAKFVRALYEGILNFYGVKEPAPAPKPAAKKKAKKAAKPAAKKSTVKSKK